MSLKFPENPLRTDPPGTDEYATYHGRYVSLVPEGEILVTLAAQAEELLAIFRGVTDQEASRSQAPYLWSLKDAVGHVIDTERVFAYRALRFARNDPTPLPSFDQDDYVANASFQSRGFEGLLAEFLTVREATLALFRGFQDDAWNGKGNASGAVISVRAIAYIVAGHLSHHAEIFRSRVAALRD